MSNFESMNAMQIAGEILRTQDPDQVTPLFMELNALNPGVSAEVVNLLEKAAISDISQGATMVSISRMMTELTGQPFDLSMLVHENNLRQMQASTQVYMNVALLKGEAAHPLVRAYAQEVSQLSADEYYSPSLLLASERAVANFYSPPAFPEEVIPPKYSEMRKPKPKKGPRRFEL